MVDGKIAFSAGSTIPHLEAASAVLEALPAKIEPEAAPVGPQETTSPAVAASADADVDMPSESAPVEVKTEAPASPLPEEVAKPTAKRTVAASAPLSLPSSLFVGDLRLAILKAKLAGLNIPAEFAGEGVLICGPGVLKPEEAKGGSLVAVRKLAAGEIVLEGAMGKVYFDVRKALYGSFAHVAAAA